MRILIVDDHRNTRDALAMGLALLEFDVRTAASGHEALQAIEMFVFEWLLCDVRMPGMTGFELAARVRQSRPATCLLLMTAYDVTPAERSRILELGAELLIKPVTANVVARHCNSMSHEREGR